MWFGAFTSTTGAFVQEVAQSWLVYQLTNDPFLLGLTVFLNNAPILLPVAHLAASRPTAWIAACC